MPAQNDKRQHRSIVTRALAPRGRLPAFEVLARLLTDLAATDGRPRPARVRLRCLSPRGRHELCFITPWRGAGAFRANHPAEWTADNAARARPGRLSARSVFHSESDLYGAFVWVHRLIDSTKRRLSARAVARRGLRC